MIVSEQSACEHRAADLKDLNEASKLKPKREGRGSSFKLVIFGLLMLMTLVYFGGYIVLLSQTQSCFGLADVGQATWGGWFSNFPHEFLSCRSLNELGDALAGAFAPVAFLWLAGAVFIQSQELAAQRQELNETQEVMRQQLEVARAQVEETRASTELFRKQTEMAEREHQLREQEVADGELENAIKWLPTQLHSFSLPYWEFKEWEIPLPARQIAMPHILDVRETPVGYEEREGFQWFKRRASLNFTLTLDDPTALSFVVNGFIRDLASFRALKGVYQLDDWPQNRPSILKQLSALQQILKLTDCSSAKLKHTVSVMKVHELSRAIVELCEFCDQVDAKQAP